MLFKLKNIFSRFKRKNSKHLYLGHTRLYQSQFYSFLSVSVCGQSCKLNGKSLLQTRCQRNFGYKLKYQHHIYVLSKLKCNHVKWLLFPLESIPLFLTPSTPFYPLSLPTQKLTIWSKPVHS